MKRTQILMNKPVYLGLSILEIIKIVIEIALRSITHSYLTDYNDKNIEC